MIVNAYSVVAAFTSVLECLLGIVAIVGAWRLLRRAGPGRGGDPAGGVPGDDAAALFLPGVVLAVLAAASVPLLGLLLQSYVPQWPGVMCIRGVLRIGTGSHGAASLLPGLLTALAFTKPLLVFATGAWIAVHLVSRVTRTGPLARTVVALVAVSGVVAVADAAVESAYLFIPKQEKFLAAGCCTVVQSATTTVDDPGDPATAAAVTFGLAAAATIALAAALRATARAPVATSVPAWTWAAAAASVACVASGGAFLSDVLSRARLPADGHPCAWCLLADAPEYAFGAALAVCGAFAAAWAATVVTIARATSAAAPAIDLARRLLRFALFALPAAAAMAFVGWRFT